jgi:hypothetical protein
MWAVTAESKFRVRDLCPGRQDWFARTEILFQERHLNCSTAFLLPVSVAADRRRALAI